MTDGMQIIDLGACVGLFIDDCLKKYKVKKIYAFEPLKANYNFLIEKYKDYENVVIFNAAISNFDGTATLYKKQYKNRNWGPDREEEYDFAGNAGSSLNSNKYNIQFSATEITDVLSLSSVFDKFDIEHVDILKIDTEGTEYEIIEDALDNAIYKKIEKIMYEDHERSIHSEDFRRNKEKIISRIEELKIKDKFFVQKDHIEYVPFAEVFTKI